MDIAENKQNVVAFYDLMYIQHDPHVGDGNGKIVEHRDVLQIIPGISVNNNTLF
jgi:predicted SnoaL-like aldol condensation-catalyzing enzyme